MLHAAEEGSHAADFLSQGVGARALGMGSAFVSIADDATATYWNPAGLAQIRKHAFSAMYADAFGSGQGGALTNGLVQYNFVNYVRQLEGIGTVGLSWIRLGVDDIPRTTFVDTNGNGILGDFQDKNGNGIKEEGELYIDRPQVAEYISNTDNALLISYGRRLNAMLAVGGSLKLVRQSLFEFAGSGFGIDLGVLLSPIQGLRVGAMLSDATGTQIHWNTPDEPTFTRGVRLRFGASYQLALATLGSVTVGAELETDRKDLERDTGSEVVYRAGAEYWLFHLIALRVGVEDDEFAAGAGLRLRLGEATLSADYAFNSHELGNSQRVSLSGLF